MEENNDGLENEEEDEEERRRRWREIYGDMVPEKIVDTKIGEDGKRYYKVQWAVSNFEPAKNFLEAELLVRKYWDPVEKKLKLPSNKKKKEKSENGEASNTEESASSSSSLLPESSSSSPTKSTLPAKPCSPTKLCFYDKQRQEDENSASNIKERLVNKSEDKNKEDEEEKISCSSSVTQTKNNTNGNCGTTDEKNNPEFNNIHNGDNLDYTKPNDNIDHKRKRTVELPEPLDLNNKEENDEESIRHNSHDEPSPKKMKE